MWGDTASENPGWPSCLVTEGGARRWAGWELALTGSIQGTSGRASADKWINEVSAYEEYYTAFKKTESQCLAQHS